MFRSKWFLEQTTDHEGSFHSIEEILFQGSSEYQQIEVLKTGSYGKCLVLDGKMQSSEADEFIYHEALVHPAMFLCPEPRKVLIAGGGEGATAREVLKHPSVSEVVVVDLDQKAVEVCIDLLPEWHDGAYDDDKVQLLHEDARGYIENAAEEFDVIIMDLPEPFDGGPALMLYTDEFYSMVHNALKDDGVMVTQAASTSVNNLQVFTAIANTVQEAFSDVRPYSVNIPSFYSPWGFVLASKTDKPHPFTEKICRERMDELQGDLGFYDHETHQGIFSLPRYLRKAIKKEASVITDSSTISFY